MAIAKAYFGDRTIFETARDIEEHVKWLLPSKNADDDEGIDVEEAEGDPNIVELVRQQKRGFFGALFLWENGLIGVGSEEPVRKYPVCFSYTQLALHPPTPPAVRIPFEPAHP